MPLARAAREAEVLLGAFPGAQNTASCVAEKHMEVPPLHPHFRAGNLRPKEGE